MSVGAGKIRTTHSGSLPRSGELLEVNARWERGEIPAEEAEAVLTRSVEEVVRRQAEIGIDIINDGEYGKLMTGASDAGAWASYAMSRLDGWERSSADAHEGLKFLRIREMDRFPTTYRDTVIPQLVGPSLERMNVLFTGPVSYVGQEAIARDIANLKAAMSKADVAEAFMSSIGPNSVVREDNPHYGSRPEYMMAMAEALHEEYKAIVDAGFTLQLDEPRLADGWAFAPPEMTLEQYRELVKLEVSVLNHALEGIPAEKVRLHVCWGSWHGPHSTDIPLREIVDQILQINVGAFVVEAGNVRHELDWQVWQEIEVPDHLTLVPGVVSHATNLVEPEELVADRIARYTETVGPERVIAGTDCGLGGRVHPELAWAKLEALTAGARLATNHTPTTA